ncbi:MAG: hypothetical protein ACPL4K_06120, partial [Candidatus Margulisiibacteriota bacterium]
MVSLMELELARKTLREDPENFWALRQVAKYYLNEDYFRQAQSLYTQVVAISPRILPEVLLDYEQKIEKDPDRIGPRLSLAGFALTIGEVDLAILELEEVIDIAPECVEAYNALGKIYV